MRPTFLGFEASKRGLVATQKNLDITNHNLANADTPGYTRQRLDLFSMTNAGRSYRYATNNATFAGQGVIIGGVAQIRDPFLDRRFRETYGTLGENEVKLGGLNDVDNTLDEITTDNILTSLGNISKELQNLANDPSKVESANIVQTSMKNIVQILRQYDVQLSQAKEQMEFELDTSVKSANSILAKLAGMNQQIQAEYMYGSLGEDPLTEERRINEKYGPNELLDDRNTMLDELSRLGNVTTKQEADGTVTVSIAGEVVVQGNKYTSISVIENSNTESLDLRLDNGHLLDLSTGALKGYQDMINGRGYYAKGQNAYEGIPYYQETINTFAQQLAQNFNDTHRKNMENAIAEGRLPADTPIYTMFTSTNVNQDISAGNITLSDEWVADPMMITKSLGDGDLDSSPILNLIDVLKRDINFGQFEGTIEGYVTYYTNKLSQQISFTSGRLDANETTTTQLLDRRDQISAVSIDEEGVNLLNYEKAFQAQARMVTALDEALDQIINKMGLVGRG